MEFKELISTFNLGDIAIIKSILESEEIGYYVQGENFNLVSPMIVPSRVLVREDQLQEAQELINDLTISYGSGSLSDEDDIENDNENNDDL